MNLNFQLTQGMKSEKNKLKKNKKHPSQPRLICKTCDLSHKTGISLYKANKKKYKAPFTTDPMLNVEIRKNKINP